MTTQYLNNPGGPGLVGEFNVSGNAIAQFAQGMGLVSQTEGNGSSAYYNFDLTGNTTELTGANGAVANAYSYLPFGETTSSTGVTPNPFTYGGEFGVVAESPGLYLMGTRGTIPTWEDSWKSMPLDFLEAIPTYTVTPTISQQLDWTPPALP